MKSFFGQLGALIACCLQDRFWPKVQPHSPPAYPPSLRVSHASSKSHDEQDFGQSSALIAYPLQDPSCQTALHGLRQAWRLPCWAGISTPLLFTSVISYLPCQQLPHAPSCVIHATSFHRRIQLPPPSTGLSAASHWATELWAASTYGPIALLISSSSAISIPPAQEMGLCLIGAYACTPRLRHPLWYPFGVSYEGPCRCKPAALGILRYIICALELMLVLVVGRAGQLCAHLVFLPGPLPGLFWHSPFINHPDRHLGAPDLTHECSVLGKILQLFDHHRCISAVLADPSFWTEAICI